MTHIVDLILQFFMALTLIAGVAMLVFTLGYKELLTTGERAVRYMIGSLLVYSVIVRYLIILPGPFKYMRETSIIFDLFYPGICILLTINLVNRKLNDKSGT